MTTSVSEDVKVYNIHYNICSIGYTMYVKSGILLTFGKHLHDRIISVREEIWALKTSLTLPLIEVTVPSQESEWSCICVWGIE